MKKSKLFAVFVCFVFLSSSCRKQSSKSDANHQSAYIHFADTLHDFGVIDQSSPVDSFDFVFTNAGQGRLVILGVNTSCHCTHAEYPKYPIEPGESASVKVTYDGDKRGPEYFNKTVQVISNATNDYVVLRICGELK